MKILELKYTDTEENHFVAKVTSVEYTSDVASVVANFVNEIATVTAPPPKEITKHQLIAKLKAESVKPKKPYQAEQFAFSFLESIPSKM